MKICLRTWTSKQRAIDRIQCVWRLACQGQVTHGEPAAVRSEVIPDHRTQFAFQSCFSQSPYRRFQITSWICCLRATKPNNRVKCAFTALRERSRPVVLCDFAEGCCQGTLLLCRSKWVEGRGSSVCPPSWPETLRPGSPWSTTPRAIDSMPFLKTAGKRSSVVVSRISKRGSRDRTAAAEIVQ